jgi:hypothetical protein
MFVVVLGSANSDPLPGLHGKRLAVSLTLCVFAVALLIASATAFPSAASGCKAQ